MRINGHQSIWIMRFDSSVEKIIYLCDRIFPSTSVDILNLNCFRVAFLSIFREKNLLLDLTETINSTALDIITSY